MSEGKRLVEILEVDTAVSKPQKDPIDETLEDETRELAKEVKLLRLLELRERKRKELEKLMGESSGAPAVQAGGLEIPPQLVIEIAKLPDEQRERAIQVAAALIAASRSQGNSAMLPLLAILMGRQQNGHADPSQLIKIVTEIAKQQNSPNATVEVIREAIASLKDLYKDVKDSLEKKVEEIERKSKPQPSPLELVLLDDKLYERFSKLFAAREAREPAGKSEIDPKVKLEIEKLKALTRLKLAKMKQEMMRMRLKAMKEAEAEKARWEAISKLFSGPAGTSLAALLGALAAGATARAGAPLQQQAQQPPVQAGLPQGVEQVTCTKCGRQFYVLSEMDKAICPSCGTIYERVSGNEQVEGGGQRSEGNTEGAGS